MRLWARENRDYEVPDALAARDYLGRPDLFVSMARERRALGDLEGWAPRRYTWFPYPKAVGGFRQMAATDPVDWIVYRILGFQAGEITDPVLSANVFGNRLDRAGGWSTRLAISAWTAFRDYQLQSLHKNKWGYTCISDITGFYPSIDTSQLIRELGRLGVGEAVVGPLDRLLTFWASGKAGLVGLPVGGQASGVISNAYLASMDELLQDVASDFAMYGDDFAIFDHDRNRGRNVVTAVDDHLNGLLGLRRNLGKTDEFFDALEAASAIENSALSYLAAAEGGSDDTAASMLYDFWDHDVLEAPVPNLSEVHFVLGKLGKRGDSYAVRSLLDRRDLMAIDPKSAIDYITDTALGRESVAEELSSLLTMPATPTTEAVHLHICRHLAEADHGSVVGAAVDPIIDDRAGFRGPTRAMAVQARVRCPGWSFADAIERADPEPDFWVRHSLVGSTKRLVDRPRTKRLALRELARRDRSLIPTAAWAVAL
jgi:hypothetical protein